MKKPNITPSEWEVKPEEADVTYIRIRGTVMGSRYKICNVHSPTYDIPKELQERELSESRANAKAISAVPEMIDASIELISLLEKERLAPDAWIAVYELEEALKKAGVEL